MIIIRYRNSYGPRRQGTLRTTAAAVALVVVSALSAFGPMHSTYSDTPRVQAAQVQVVKAEPRAETPVVFTQTARAESVKPEVKDTKVPKTEGKTKVANSRDYEKAQAKERDRQAAVDANAWAERFRLTRVKSQVG